MRARQGNSTRFLPSYIRTRFIDFRGPPSLSLCLPLTLSICPAVCCANASQARSGMSSIIFRSIFFSSLFYCYFVNLHIKWNFLRDKHIHHTPVLMKMKWRRAKDGVTRKVKYAIALGAWHLNATRTKRSASMYANVNR